VSSWITSGDGFILVSDTNSKKSFNHIRQLHDRIQSQKSHNGSKVPVVIVGTKSDCGNWQVDYKEGSALAKELIRMRLHRNIYQGHFPCREGLPHTDSHRVLSTLRI
jgi:GTPase SAR1 family protein